MGTSAIGQIFTPDFVAKFMVSNILTHLKQSTDISTYFKEIETISVLEPSVGKGVFLKSLLEYGFTDITAYELDYSFEKALRKNFPDLTIHYKNILTSTPKEKFEIIIGNPPYLGHNYNSELFQDYISKSELCKRYFVGNMDLFYYFIHLGIELLKPGGYLSFITTNYWLSKSKKTGIKHLKPHILDECYLLQYIDLSKLKLFPQALGQENCIFVLQKKNERDKRLKLNKKIKIIQVNPNRNPQELCDTEYNRLVFNLLSNGSNSGHFKRYLSATTHNDLEGNRSWNLLYPMEVKDLTDKIEQFCIKNCRISYLKDYFLIRNGLIFIKDDIFILQEKETIIHENGGFSIKIDDDFIQLNKKEQMRLKKLYKSSSIQKYGYIKDAYKGYALYFNRNSFIIDKATSYGSEIKNEYPNLYEYLQQYQKELQATLKNAKEDQSHYFFPRRGDRIRKMAKKGSLVYLQEHYEKAKKIFFPYITDRNIFGYSDEPFFATSDVYFLWPKIPEEKIDYNFLLAYLNSEIVHFLFHTKNIKIKRSKTKLENSLPIPNLDHPSFYDKKELITLIRNLSGLLIRLNTDTLKTSIDEQITRLKQLEYFSPPEKNGEFQTLSSLIEEGKKVKIENYVNHLFYDLFDIQEDTMKELMRKYYNS
ncbi:MAG: Modification methylase TaqI [Promethearchaeota archaeon]|nr:MAG: Modification methylase TaqI [Candidatus Lokiarchaeota archaeon]